MALEGRAGFEPASFAINLLQSADLNTSINLRSQSRTLHVLSLSLANHWFQRSWSFNHIRITWATLSSSRPQTTALPFTYQIRMF